MLLPEPDKPLISTSCIRRNYSRRATPPRASAPGIAGRRLAPHLGVLALDELRGRLDAPQLQDVVADRGLDQHGEVAPGRDGNDDLADRDAQDVLGELVQRQALGLGAGL